MTKKMEQDVSKEKLMTNGYTWVEQFCTHFTGRDLAYIFAGGIFICVVEYAWYNKIFFPQQLSLELIGFLSVSYVLGLVFRDLVSIIWPCLNYDTPTNYPSEIVLFQVLIENYNINVFDRYERNVYFQTANKSIGASSLFGGVLMVLLALKRWFFNEVIPSENYVVLTIILFLIGIFMLDVAKRRARNIEFHQGHLIDYIELRREKKTMDEN